MQNYFERPESVEARAIMRLVELGTTNLDGARELIGIPETQAAALREFAKVGGKAGAKIGAAVKFRESVMKEFERLVSAAGLEMLASNLDLTIH